MNNDGWIKLHRSILNHWVFQKPEYFKMWIYLLLKANYEGRVRPFGMGYVEVKRGEIITSLERIALDCAVTKKVVRVFLERVEKESMVVTERTRNGTHITICNYETYQDEGHDEGHKKGTRRAHAGHTQGTTIRNEEVNKGRRIQPKKVVLEIPPDSIDDLWHYAEAIGIDRPDYENWFYYNERKGWKKFVHTERGLKGSLRNWKLKMPLYGAVIVHPTAEEVGTFALAKWPDQMDGTNPELSYAKDFYRHYQKQGWKLGNGNPITDWKTALVEWVENKMRGL